ncbi:hypothetical protein [Sphingopyxis sp.]|uniref:hypothetical protein n=1 Tax=Sphingopyxis sp. TaxID=1908224 RepID=UPI003D09D02C
MNTALISFGSLLVFAAVVAGGGALWSYWGWVQSGRPRFTANEQLQIDILRAQGRTLRSARSVVLEQRSSPFIAQIDAIRDTMDLANNPDREGELRDLLRR